MKSNFIASHRCSDMPVYRYSVMAMVLMVYTVSFAQDLDRTVTVERDFQPVIQSAGKIHTQPAVVETTIEPVTVEYSDYTAEVNPGITLSPILSQPTRFAATQPYHGYVRGAFGHVNTLFDFGYRLDDKKKSVLDVYAHHRAQWGLKTLSKSKLGMNFTHQFSTCDLYFGVNGGNVFFHKYGHFFDYSLAPTNAWVADKVAYPAPAFTDKDKTTLWTAEAFIGVKSNPRQEVQYKFQTGYALFAKANAVAEHQVRTHGAFDWHRDEHHVGVNAYVQNNFLQLRGNLAATIPDSLYTNRHNIRFEPYYAYEGRRVNLHVGINLDMNIGKGHQHLSNVKDLSFAPSPHINLEAQIARNWLTVYADVLGNQGLGSLQSYMEENRYSLIHAGIIHPCGAYTPVDAEVGFHIRPYRDLYIELHGGYAYMIDEDYWIATADTVTPMEHLTIKRPLGEFVHRHTNYQRGKVGAAINYHYQDIIRINLYGDYYFWRGDTTVYDRPNWEAGLRIDGRIDQHWSLYSDNYFAGKRIALATDGEHILKPTVQLNLGLQYEMWIGKVKQPNLTLFFQLNNWLHYKNDIFYGYQSEGINFLLGATYRF